MGFFYNRTTWLARLGTGLNRFSLKHADNTTEQVTLTSDPVSVTQQGTQFTATAMNNMESFLNTLDNHVLTGSLTLYVRRVSGDDANDGLSPGTAKQTLQGALNALPKDLAGYNVMIDVYGNPGTADSAVTISRIQGGRITIMTSNASYTYSCEGISVTDSGTVLFDLPVAVVANGSAYAVLANASVLRFSDTLTITGDAASAAILSTHEADIEVAGSLSVNLTSGANRHGAQAYAGSQINLQACTIHNADYAFYATSGGRITYQSLSTDNTTVTESTYSGGRIYTGKQNEVFDTSYYINYSSGSDSNPGTAASAPKKTLQAVISALPKDLGGRTVTINVQSASSSNPDDSVSMYTFSNGNLVISGDYFTRSMLISHCDYVRFTGRLGLVPNNATTISNALTVENGSYVRVEGYLTCVSGTFGNDLVRCTSNATLLLLNDINISSSTAANRYGLHAFYGGSIHVTGSAKISTVQYGATAGSGGVITLTSVTMTGVTNRFVTSGGGRIYRGAQADMLTSNLTLYVSTPTGGKATNDGIDPGDGSGPAPLDTISTALSRIPKDLNGYAARIIVQPSLSSATVYNNPTEDVTIANFHGGTLTIEIQGNTTIRSLTVARSTSVELTSDDPTIPYVLAIGAADANTAMYVVGKTFVYCNIYQTRVVGYTTYGVRVIRGAEIYFDGALSVRPSLTASAAVSGTYGVTAASLGRVHIVRTYDTDGAAPNYPHIRYNQFALRAVSGGQISYDEAMVELSGNTTDLSTSAGGVIHSVAGGDTLTADLTLYVNPTGDARNTGRSASSPLPNINTALARIPKNLNGYTATIKLSAGYLDRSETVSAKDFHGGSLVIALTGSSTCGLGSLTFEHCSYASIVNDTGSTAALYLGDSGVGTPLTVSRFSQVRITVADVRITRFTANGIAAYSSDITLTGSVGIRPSESATAAVSGTNGISAQALGRVWLSSTTTSSYPGVRYCQRGLYATGGGMIAYGTDVTLSGNTNDYITASGGRIYAGAQTSAPSY